jgi:hypothetical protein
MPTELKVALESRFDLEDDINLKSSDLLDSLSEASLSKTDTHRTKAPQKGWK